jgi:REP element-mobilizing transposase RayT
VHNIPGTEFDQDIPALHHAATKLLRGEPIRLNREQADALQSQFRETAAFRGWQIIASAIMANHVPLVVGVAGNPDPTKILGDFKAFGSRAMNAMRGKPAAGTWWAYSGSKRKLGDESSLIAAVAYV